MRTRPIFQIALTALLFSSVTTNAQSSRQPIDVDALGPQVGDLVPDFRLADQKGDTHTFDDVAGPKGALILFHRSADW